MKTHIVLSMILTFGAFMALNVFSLNASELKPLGTLEGFHGDTSRMENYYLLGANQKLFLIDSQGQILNEKKYSRGCIHDITSFFTNEVMVSYGDGTEILSFPQLKTQWEYRPKTQAGGGVYSGEAILGYGNGRNVYVAENSTGRILHLNIASAIVDSIQTDLFKAGDHQNFRIMRRLQNGNFLVCHSGKNTVREYDPKGKVVWEQKTKALAFKAVRLQNGNTLIASLDQIEEYSPDHKIVWSMHKSEIKACKINNMTGFEVLKTGNFLIGCYSNDVTFLEVTRDKNAVWWFSNPKKVGKTIMTLLPINSLTQVDLYKSSQP